MFLALLAGLVAAPAARAFEFFDGRLQAHGFYRVENRYVAKDYDPHDWYMSQLAQTLSLELEADVAPNGFGPFNSIGLFSRVEVRFECLWADGCGIYNARRYWGEDHSARDFDKLFEEEGEATNLHDASRTLTDGKTHFRAGVIPFTTPMRVHEDNEALPFFLAPAFEPLLGLGGGNLKGTLAPVDVIPLIYVKKIDEGFEQANWTLGPVNRNADVDSLAVLNKVQSLTPVVPLKPQIPAPGSFPDDPEFAQGLWAPHYRLREKVDEIEDGSAFNLSEGDLAWNHGQSQDEHELKELYADLELLDGRLFVRLGKQTIVWGKTELFRNQDQWNPQDVGLSSLPSLEESRIGLWAARAIYSFYNVGPLEDVRFEVATVIDDFESIDAGTCLEPYAIWLVCAGSFGFTAHGLTGAGLAGAISPEDPWEDLDGLEIGARLEWRTGRFSFALTDFWGYSDIPYLDRFVGFERAVDPKTGRPLNALGEVADLNNPEEYLALDPQNRTLFEFACSVSVGVAAAVIPVLANECALSIFNSSTPIAANPIIPGGQIGVADAFAQALAGTGFGGLVIDGAAGLPTGTTPSLLVRLSMDPFDGGTPVPITPTTNLACANFLIRFVFGGGTNPVACLSELLTNEQEALLGCGPFYGTDCDISGFDIYNAEASVIFQYLPMFEPGGPVGTRFVNGKLVQLPGARGPGDAGYDPRVDGCVGPLPKSKDPKGLCAASRILIDPATGKRFRSEMAAASYNLLLLLVAFGVNNDPEGDCAIGGDPVLCNFVRGIFGTTGVTRPDLLAGGNGRFGRRDFVWANGGLGLLRFNKRNMLGFATDFAEDFAKTNWSIEATWTSHENIPDDDSPRLWREADIYQVTVSVDRPTFVNFLNLNRTLLFNSQVFFQYVVGEGPMDVLGTFTIFTGYFQDRLLTQLTFVHDLRSASGGVIADLTYRFSSRFSASFGLAGFYGGPSRARTPLFPLVNENNGGDYKTRSAYPGLSILSQRDEASFVFRYTF